MQRRTVARLGLVVVALVVAVMINLRASAYSWLNRVRVPTACVADVPPSRAEPQGDVSEHAAACAALDSSVPREVATAPARSSLAASRAPKSTAPLLVQHLGVSWEGMATRN